MTIFARKTIFLVAFLLVLLTYSNVVSSNQGEVQKVVENPVYKVSDVSVKLSTDNYAVFDLETGEILISNNINKVLPIASVTKLFTATALVENLPLDSVLVIKDSDVAAEGLAGKLIVGEKYLYRELLFPLLLESSNDAAAAFERDTNGEVIKQMNSLVGKIEASNTSFTDASGLADSNVSTVHDLITFLEYLHKNEPHVLDMASLKQYIGPYTGWLNNNPVFGIGYKGGKHGYTEAANRTLVALFEEDLKTEKRTLGYIVLGSDNLVSDISILRGFVNDSITFE